MISLMNVTLQKFEYPRTLIKEFKFWTVQLRPKQVTLGSLVLINKSEALHLGELSDAEWAEFAEVSSLAERLLKKVFSPDKFNYLALMMKDPNVHFHMIPRYERDVKFAGQTFTDPDWPGATNMQAISVGGGVFDRILDELKAWESQDESSVRLLSQRRPLEHGQRPLQSPDRRE